MAVLATYKAHVTPKYDTFLPFRVAVACIAAVVFIGGAVLTTYLNWRVEVLLLYLFVLCFVVNAVVYIDTYMKWHCTEETVSVQHEMLVVERRKCLFRRRKEIPLSAIRKVETYDDGSGQRSATHSQFSTNINGTMRLGSILNIIYVGRLNYSGE